MNIQLILRNIIIMTSFTSCIHQNNIGNNITSTAQKQKIEKIQLTERTRGYSKSVVITPISKTVDINGEVSNSKISSSEWNTISQLAEAIDLSKISGLESPTTGRHSDRALAGSIIISSNGTDHTSSSFDSGHPPKELEALYNVIRPGKKDKP